MVAPQVKIASLLSRDEFQALNACNDRIAYAHIFIRIAVHAGFFCLVAWSWLAGQTIVALVALYVNAVLWQFLGYAGIGHELFHKKVFSYKPMNAVLYRLFSYLTWNNPTYFEKSHQFHHSAAFHEDDSEIYRDFPLNLMGAARLALIDHISLCRRIAYAFANACGYELYFGNGVRLKRMRPGHKAQQDALFMLFVNALLLGVVYVATWSPAVVVMVFLTPFMGHLPNRVLALAQHSGLDDHKDDGALLFSRTLTLPLPIAFFYANMNYHAEHHLLPSVPYYNLRRLHDVINARMTGKREEHDLRYLFSRAFWSNVNTTSRQHLRETVTG